MARAPRIGERCTRLELEGAWLLDPATGREGRGSLLIEGGRIAELRWARRGRAASPPPPVLVTAGFLDLHAHLREPGNEDAETVATGLAAAAHGGFTRVCLMPNTTPPVDNAGVLGQVTALAAASGSPVRALVYATTSAGRAGTALSPMGELAAAGAIGFSDDGAPVGDAMLLRHALAYAGALGRPVVEHPETLGLTAGAEMHEGLTATVLGLRGAPAGAEEAAVARALAILAEVRRAAPVGADPRLHLTHVSTAGSVALIRAAKRAGLPVTCDVTPHHLALHDAWVGGDRRFAWDAVGAPWAGGAADAGPFDPATRVNPPLRSPDHALALWEALTDGTVDAIATDHAPHREVDKRVEFGEAATGISGLETAVGLVLAGVEASLAPLARAIGALTTGPARVIGSAIGGAAPGLAVGALADLVVIDRSDGWTVSGAALLSRGRNTPLLGRRLPGRVMATVARGRLAYLDPELA